MGDTEFKQNEVVLTESRDIVAPFRFEEEKGLVHASLTGNPPRKAWRTLLEQAIKWEKSWFSILFIQKKFLKNFGGFKIKKRGNASQRNKITGPLNPATLKAISRLSPRTQGIYHLKVFDRHNRFIGFTLDIGVIDEINAELSKEELDGLIKKLRKQHKFAESKTIFNDKTYYSLSFGSKEQFYHHLFDTSHENMEKLWRLLVKESLKWKKPRMVVDQYEETLASLDRFAVKESMFPNLVKPFIVGRPIEARMNKESAKILGQIQPCQYGLVFIRILDETTRAQLYLSDAGFIDIWDRKSQREKFKNILKKAGIEFYTEETMTEYPICGEQEYRITTAPCKQIKYSDRTKEERK